MPDLVARLVAQLLAGEQRALSRVMTMIERRDPAAASNWANQHSSSCPLVPDGWFYSDELYQVPAASRRHPKPAASKFPD